MARPISPMAGSAFAHQPLRWPPHVAARMTCARAARSKHCQYAVWRRRRRPRPPYLSGPILKIATSPWPSRSRKRAGRGFRHLQFPAQAAFNSGASMPRRRTRVSQIQARRQMHPRLEGIAVDGADDVDRRGACRDFRPASTPSRLSRADRRRPVDGQSAGAASAASAPHGSTCHARSTNIQGSDAPKRRLLVGGRARTCSARIGQHSPARRAESGQPARQLPQRPQKSEAMPCTPSRRSGWAPVPCGPWNSFGAAWRWPAAACRRALGFGKRALGGWRQRLAFPDTRGAAGQSIIATLPERR